MTEEISKAEIRKDTVQETAEAVIGTAGQVGGILTGALKDVVTAVGDLATELFEIRDSARRARGATADEPAADEVAGE